MQKGLIKAVVGLTYETQQEDIIAKTTFLKETNDDKVRIHPAHGPSSTIKNEKENNFYYRDWESIIPK